jgi:dolichyl-phosphate-mannose--protein O-mannosyl transferase
VARYAAIVLALAALTRVVALTSPREVIFDEVTFGKFVNYYCCTGERFFDMHPPHGRMMLAAPAVLAGYDGTFTFEKIGQPYGDAPLFALRLVPALTGTLIPLLFFVLLRQLGGSPAIAFLGGVLAALDNAYIAETRIIVFDGVLVAATLGAVNCFLAAQRSPARRRIWLLVAAGALAGLAVGSKLTGLAALGLMLVCLVGGFGIVREQVPARVRQAAVLVAMTALVYVAGWIAHWLLLPNPGPGDAFYPTTGRIVDDFMAAQRTLIEQNLNFKATHPDGSAAWTWPLMKVVPYFWVGPGASMYMLGNPIVWWGSTAGIAAIGIFGFLRRLGLAGKTKLPATRPMPAKQPMRTPAPGKLAPAVSIALLAYALTYLPLFTISRVMFMYHYLTPLLFGLAFVLLWLDRAGWTTPEAIRRQRATYFAALAAAVAGFVLVSPLTYGFSAAGYDEWLSALVRSWR